MIAICTKYLSPTNTRGARIKAYAGEDSTLSVTIPYPHTSNFGVDAHFVAVVEWNDRYAPGANHHWLPGGIVGGYCWVRQDTQPYTTVVKA